MAGNPSSIDEFHSYKPAFSSGIFRVSKHVSAVQQFMWDFPAMFDDAGRRPSRRPSRRQGLVAAVQRSHLLSATSQLLVRTSEAGAVVGRLDLWTCQGMGRGTRRGMSSVCSET